MFESEGWDVVFALVNKAFATAPTRLELIAPMDPADAARPRGGRKVYDSQAPRTIRTHATVVATPDIVALAERVRRAGVRHWFQEPAQDVPFQRLWLGVPVGHVGDYDPDAGDGGFRFEFLPSNSSAFSPKLFQRPEDEPRPGEAGFRRIRHRAFLVGDIDASLATLERVFGWEPAHAVTDEPSRGYRFVDMSANHGHGATLRLVQATDPDSAAGRTFAAEGPGAWTITVAAYDLDATAADLAARGTAFRRLAPGKAEPEALVPDLTGGLQGAITLVPDSIG